MSSPITEIPVDGEAFVQDERGQNVDPLATGPRLDINQLSPKNALFSDDSGVVRGR